MPKYDKYEYATRESNKVSVAKESLHQQAARNGQEIVGFHVFASRSYPKLHLHDATKGQEFTIIQGFTSQRDLDGAKKQAAVSAE